MIIKILLQSEYSLGLGERFDFTYFTRTFQFLPTTFLQPRWDFTTFLEATG